MTFRHVLRRRPVRERRPSQKGPSAFDRLLALSGPGFRQTYVCTHMHARTCALLSSLSLVIVLPTATVTHRRARVHACTAHARRWTTDGWPSVTRARPAQHRRTLHAAACIQAASCLCRRRTGSRTRRGVLYGTVRGGELGRDRPRPRASICCHCYTDICTCKLAFPLFLIPRSTTSKHHASHACVSAVSSSILASMDG